jgi:hypothetical protein
MANTALVLILVVGCSFLAFRLALGFVDQVENRLKALTERVNKLDRPNYIITGTTATTGSASTVTYTPAVPPKKKRVRKAK